MPAQHSWRFFRAGGVDQVRLSTGADLISLEELDLKLWVALSCPVKGLEIDERTLALIDTDGDGRVHANELIVAAKWAGGLLKDPEDLAKQSPELHLDAINRSVEEGKTLYETAKALLGTIGKSDATTLAIGDIQTAIEKFNKEPWNGDGVVPVNSALSSDENKAIADVLACTDSPAEDKTGEPGINAEAITSFFAELNAYVGWLDQGQNARVRLFGDSTPAAWTAYQAVRAKVDDFFTRCRVAAFDVRALKAVNRESSEYLAAAAKDLQITADEIAHFPLAHVDMDAVLPLAKGVNPAWSDAIERFRDKVVAPLLGKDKVAINRDEWMKIRAAFAEHTTWQADKKGSAVEKLGQERARELLKDNWEVKLNELVAKDESLRPLAEAREKVEKLAHLNRDLLLIANNVVSFRDFYARRGPAAFQAGTLYIDQRACELCMRVDNPAKHAAMAIHAKSYLLYCDLKNSAGETMSIVAAMTNGDSDNLMVGRNGVFYDRKGKIWDATVNRIVDNPISVRQAFWSPYKKVLRILEEQIEKRARTAESASDTKLASATTAHVTATADGTPPPPPAAPPVRKLDIGVVAAIGVAVGGITAALGALLGAFFGLGIWMPFGVLGLILLISGPSMAIAWLKLRQRNLGPLLDANGWAVNTKARVNVPLGEALTSVAAIPKGASRDMVDPFAEKRRPWGWYFILLLLLGLAIAWCFGKVDSYLPEQVRSAKVLGDMAPAKLLVPPKSAPSP
jgi:hypothetical protein